MAVITTEPTPVDDLEGSFDDLRDDLCGVYNKLRHLAKVRDWREPDGDQTLADKTTALAERLDGFTEEIDQILSGLDPVEAEASALWASVIDLRHLREHEDGRCGCQTFQMTLTLFNRGKVAEWIGAGARLPEDRGSDALLVDTSNGTVVIALGDTVERTMAGFRKLPRGTQARSDAKAGA